jgi:hypothetical protein
VENRSYETTGIVGGDLMGLSLDNYGPSTFEWSVNPCEF